MQHNHVLTVPFVVLLLVGLTLIQPSVSDSQDRSTEMGHSHTEDLEGLNSSELREVSAQGLDEQWITRWAQSDRDIPDNVPARAKKFSDVLSDDPQQLVQNSGDFLRRQVLKRAIVSTALPMLDPHSMRARRTMTSRDLFEMAWVSVKGAHALLESLGNVPKERTP